MRLSYHARTFIVECPLWDQVLHRQRVITRPQAVFLVQLMRFHDLVHIQFYAQTRRSRNLYHTAFDFKRLFGQALVALLPDRQPPRG